MNFVLFTTNLAGGGAEKALAKIGSGLAQLGHRVDFVVCEATGPYPPPLGCHLHVLQAGAASKGWLGKRALAWRLHRWLKTAPPPDLLVSTLPFADEVAQLAAAPRHVCRIANTLSQELARLSPQKAARRAERYRRLYGARPLIAVSQGVAADMQKNFGVAMQRIRTIPNPFDFAQIRDDAAQACPSRPQPPYLIHIGRYAAQKRHDLLFEAYKISGVNLPLVLLAPPEPGLQDLVVQYGLGDRLVIADFQANPYPWLAGAELLVLCSDHEGLPNVLIEALVCGTRVVSTDCPSGPREILRGELARHLAPCGDAAALAAALRATLAQPRPTRAQVDKVLAPYAAQASLDAYIGTALEFRE